jgi:hypothetical protein
MYSRLFVPGRPIVMVCLLLSAGCGPSRPNTASVSGRVTFQGKPVTEGTIVFQPENGRPGMSQIGPDGSYSLRTFDPGDGALLGRHRVTIEARRIAEQNPVTGVLRIEWLVPEKYARLESSPLTANVVSGTNKLDFDLRE